MTLVPGDIVELTASAELLSAPEDYLSYIDDNQLRNQLLPEHWEHYGFSLSHVPPPIRGIVHRRYPTRSGDILVIIEFPKGFNQCENRPPFYAPFYESQLTNVSLEVTGLQIGEPVELLSPREVYSGINSGYYGIGWLNEEQRGRAGYVYWSRSGYYPQEAQQGIIVGFLLHCSELNPIALTDITSQFLNITALVPILPIGLRSKWPTAVSVETDSPQLLPLSMELLESKYPTIEVSKLNYGLWLLTSTENFDALRARLSQVLRLWETLDLDFVIQRKPGFQNAPLFEVVAKTGEPPEDYQELQVSRWNPDIGFEPIPPRFRLNASVSLIGNETEVIDMLVRMGYLPSNRQDIVNIHQDSPIQWRVVSTGSGDYVERQFLRLDLTRFRWTAPMRREVLEDLFVAFDRTEDRLDLRSEIKFLDGAAWTTNRSTWRRDAPKTIAILEWLAGGVGSNRQHQPRTAVLTFVVYGNVATFEAVWSFTVGEYHTNVDGAYVFVSKDNRFRQDGYTSTNIEDSTSLMSLFELIQNNHHSLLRRLDENQPSASDEIVLNVAHRLNGNDDRFISDDQLFRLPVETGTRPLDAPNYILDQLQAQDFLTQQERAGAQLTQIDPLRYRVFAQRGNSSLEVQQLAVASVSTRDESIYALWGTSSHLTHPSWVELTLRVDFSTYNEPNRVWTEALYEWRQRAPISLAILEDLFTTVSRFNYQVDLALNGTRNASTDFNLAIQKRIGVRPVFVLNVNGNTSEDLQAANIQDLLQYVNRAIR